MREPQMLVLFLPLLVCVAQAQNSSSTNNRVQIPVGVVLDLDTLVGKMGQTSISMALDDFYHAHGNYGTQLALHVRDSKSNALKAASEVLDLLRNEQVQAIIGPQKSQQAAFIIDLGIETHVPIISFSSTSPSLSPTHNPYFVRATYDDASQVNAISSIVKAFGWREVVLIYEDTDYGRDVIPYLIDALQEAEAKVPYRSSISPTASNDQIMEELYMLKTMATRVFIVQMSSKLGSRLFLKAKEAGMMNKGYSWIITYGLSNLVDSFDPSIIEAMQGVLGVKPHVPHSKELKYFESRWKRRFQQDHQDSQPPEINIYGLMAYDTVWTLAMAIEKVGASRFASHQNPRSSNNSKLLESLPISSTGSILLRTILSNQFRGLSGPFHLINGQLQPSAFQIINVIGKGSRVVGYWTPTFGISKKLDRYNRSYSTTTNDLKPIIWPGESSSVPKGWEIPTSGKKLRIGVPIKEGFREFVNVKRDPITNYTTVEGYSIDVFEAIINRLPYDISYEFIPFANADGQMAGTYNDLVYQVFLKNFDAVVGDITIRANRSQYVDFTLPYTESGVSMLVPVKEEVRKNAWIFLKPLTLDLWFGSLAFFLLTGFVVWVMEHRINDDFRGPFAQQLGIIFYFSFSTLVFSHKERVENILSRIVVIVWVFVVLILTSSYTASLTSLLTVQQLKPTVTSVEELLKDGDYVGYSKGSFVEGLLKNLQFDPSKLKVYNSSDYFVEALSKGSKSGGVAAIVHEVPYIRVFLAQHCSGYMMIGPIYKTAGFGFAFPKGSPLVPDISRAILQVTDGKIIKDIEKKWFGDQATCVNQGSTFGSSRLTFGSFWGLFLITGVTSTCAILLFLANFFYRNWDDLKKIDPDKPVLKRLQAWLQYYNKKDHSSYTFRRNKIVDANGHVIDNNRGINNDEFENRFNNLNVSYMTSSPQGGSSSSPDLASPYREHSMMPFVVSR